MTQNRVNTMPSPFPGLRPFQTEETHLFFGREGQIDEVLSKMEEHKFVSILGTSGSGKSSFMYCGLIPSLHGGFMTEAGSNWQVIVMRPGNAPIYNLAESVANASLPKDTSEKDMFIARSVNQAVLQSSSLGLVELIGQNRKEEDENILILVDQFEEIFRFQDTRNEEHANERLAFIKLLTRAVEQTELPIYVVMTMRSDFIGDCAKFPQFTSMINDSHYLIPQMTREQKRTAVLGPVAVGGGKMTSRLVQQLLNDLGDNPDQLPILQHALMRTWNYWTKHEALENPIDIYHYEAIGGMAEALSQHANEAYEELNDSQQELCERIFKCLTQKGEDGRGVRRPTKLADIAAITKTTEEEVLNVIDNFRTQGRTLLTPPVNIKADGQTVIDISHESLMRIWERLKIWVEEESESVKMYQRLAEAGLMSQQGKAGLWKPPQLSVAIAWRENQQPTLAWAERHDPTYERAMSFLRQSEEEYNAEQRAKLRAQKAKAQRTKLFAMVLGLATIISIGFLVYARLQAQQAETNALEAKANAEDAEKEKKRATFAAEKARTQEEFAKQAAEKARKSETAAKQSEKKAVAALERAKQSEAEAKRQQSLAEKNADEAKAATAKSEEDRKKAEDAAEEARRAKATADANAEEAKKLRYKALAQTLAVKSLQLRDTSQKAKVAQQAFEFNEEYNDGDLNSDIYSGLYYANKLAKGEEFNQLQLQNETGSINAGEGNIVRGLAIQDNKLYSLSSNGSVKTWNISTQKAEGEPKNIKRTKEDSELKENPNYARKLLATSNGDFLVGLSNGQIRKLSDKSTLVQHKEEVLGMKQHNDYLISWDVSGTVIRTNLASQKQENLQSAESMMLFKDITISKSGDIIGITKQGKVYVWDSSKKKFNLLFEENGANGMSIAISPDEKYLVAGFQSGKINLYDYRSEKLIQNMTGHYANIITLVFSESGKYLVSGSLDKTARLWNLNSPNTPLAIFDDYEDWVWSANFSPNEDKVFIGAANGTLKAYQLDMIKMANALQKEVPNKMTKREWEQFVGKDIDYPYQD